MRSVTAFRKLATAGSIAVLLGTAGCAGMNTTQQRTLSGGAIGAGTGAAAGALSGGSAVGGALLGGALGAGGGYAYDRYRRDRN